MAAPKTTAATTLTDSPPPERPTTTMVPRSTVGLEQVTTPGPITQSSTRPKDTTTTTSTVLQARTSETVKAGNRSTAAPSETSAPWKLTDSPSIRIGIPLLAVLLVILLAFLLWWLYFQKQSGSQRQEDLHLSEETPMALMASEDNGQASDPGDSSSSSEGDPVLPSSSTSTG
nr:mucin-2-like [Anolis sagrei ordinatus]